MGKANDEKRRLDSSGKNDEGGMVPILRIKKGASLKAIYAAARRALTPADFQKFTVLETGIPARQVLAVLESVDREETRKQSRKP